MGQDDYMSTKGCKRDPYTQTEFDSFTIEEWSGGWVRNSVTNAIEYYNSSKQKQSTIAKGETANPYTAYEYNYKNNQLHNWTGGWVDYQSHILYINANNQTQSIFGLGENMNPYYYAEFHNKLVQNDWHGGWVEYESGIRVYINAQGEEDDDPNASGSGCGSGCGYPSGNMGLRQGYATSNGLTFSWGNGSFSGINNSWPYLHVQTGGSVSVFYCWWEPYIVRYFSVGGPTQYFSIPNSYRY